MMIQLRNLFLTIVLLGLLVACGGSLQNSVELEPAAPPTADSPDTDTEKGIDLAQPVIRYERSGGMMGTRQAWELYADGTLYAVHSDREWQGDPAAVDDLLTTAETAQFHTLDDSYMPADECCDRFTYTITVVSGDTHTVTTMDDAGAPDDLTQLIDAIEQFIRETTT